MSKRIMPFDLFTALKIQAGITKGRFVTRSGYAVRILCFNAGSDYPIVALVNWCSYWEEEKFTLEGKFLMTETSSFDLFIYLGEEDKKC